MVRNILPSHSLSLPKLIKLPQPGSLVRCDGLLWAHRGSAAHRV
jgi:hypothetical protein